MTQCSKLDVNLRQMIIAIETAVSLVGMNDTNHGKRVGYIASQLGQQLGFSDEEIQFLFDLGLLHDCGVSTEQMHAHIVNHFDWCDAHIHCEIGYRLLKDFEPLCAFAVPILYHHTPWEKLNKLNVSMLDARMANLIFLADRIDVLAATHYESDILFAKEEIVKSITHYKGTYFDPKIVHAFHQVERSEAFWIALESRHITRYTWDMSQFKNNRLISLAQLKQLSSIMAYIVDQKSPFTAQHSQGVASLAHYIASSLGLLDEQCDKIEVAGLLHDLGKLHVPDNILGKPGPLNEIERAIMNQHSYETYEILRHINGLEDIACWAAFHHEGLNGLGYPFHPQKQELSVEARIVAVADIFQALVQDRPYRKGMQLDEVIDILDGFVKSGKLDGDIVKHAKQHAAVCFEIAQGSRK
ncbi:MAG: putative nucleotidyltransferase with HDIG domain [Psychromonas sp.]|jgi:putative nucleotidyltransferase with HDIG domain|uniref:HD-GYP domain-containing protein n=1 Tax=Psychromonas sp. TaxID=1884585 RepID=UPI0039E669A2